MGDTFGQLLQEILSNPPSEETDLEASYKLLRVVTEAGLETLPQHDPFTRRDHLIKQAQDSISVIEITVQRAPALLLYPNQGSNESSQSQLFFWILPRIFALLGNPQADELQSALQRLFSSLITSLVGISHLWQNAVTYVNVYRSCIDDLLSALRNLSESECDRPLSIDLPPAVPQDGAFSASHQSIAQKRIPQFHVSETMHACKLAFFMIQALLGVSKSWNGVSIPQIVVQDLRNCGVEWCYSLLQTYPLWHLWFGSSQSTEAFTESYIRLLRSLLPTQEPLRQANVLMQAIATVLSRNSEVPLLGTLQLEIAKSIFTVWELSLAMHTVKQLSMDHLTPILLKVQTSTSSRRGLSPELKLVIRHWLQKHSSGDQGLAEGLSQNYVDEVGIINSSKDTEFQAAFSRLGICQPSEHESRPTKRAKLTQITQNNAADSYNRLECEIGKILGESEEEPVNTVRADLTPRFLNLPEAEQMELLNIVARLPCAASVPQKTPESSISIPNCSRCDTIPSSESVDVEFKRLTRRAWKEQFFDKFQAQILEFFTTLVSSSEFQKTTNLRVQAMLVIRRLLHHSEFTDCLDLKSSAVGQFCLKSLHSTIRELRIVAGFTLSAFVRHEVCEKYRQDNRVLALDYLRQLSSRDEVNLLETIVFAWGQVAQVCGDEELNLVLLQLIDFLGHPNPLICGLAFNELQRLSEALDSHPAELLKPFSRSISVSVVKDLIGRPQKVQQLADLLQISVNHYLLATEHETLPFLVSAKRRDILERLAAAHGPETTIQDVCMQPRANLIAILSQLLLEPASDIQSGVMTSLCEVAPGFAEYDLASLVKLDSILIMCEMLKAAGDAGARRKPQVHRSIQQIAALTETRPAKSVAKQNRAILGFFEQHILGIMAHFSDVIEKGLAIHPMNEKRSCIRAIEELVSLSEGRIGIALPQIRACLQSALDIPALKELAFSAWATMVTKLGDDDISNIIDHTFAIVAQSWDTFSDKTAQKAYDTISFLIKNHESRLRESIETVPSLAGIPVFSKIEAEIARFKSSTDLDKKYLAFAKRCLDESSVIVAQALKELEPFLESHSQFLHESASSEDPNPLIGDLIRSILDACVTFKEDRRDISIASARCLGIIGCVDPTRIDSLRERRDILILSNFERAAEAIDFAALLLETVLVKAFRSATNARAQGFLAYAMQELLRFCGFHESLTPKSRNADDDSRAARWRKMPSSIRTTLTPFLNSRYLLTSNFAQKAIQSYPIFRKTLTHSLWLRSFTSDLLRKGKGDNAETIFSILSRVIHGQEITIAAFLLPFVVLNVVIGGTDIEAENIQKELLSILSESIAASTQSEVETIKQCSENVFRILDYMSRWMQEKKKILAQIQLTAERLGSSPPDAEIIRDTSQISSVERILSCVPAAVVSSRAMDCRSYARAAYHWEIHMRQEDDKCSALGLEYLSPSLHEHLQEIYAHIDEPDAVEGLSAVLDFVKPEQQLMEYVRLQQWDSVQAWYQIHHRRDPDNVDFQIQLSRSLYESGQNDALLDMIDRVQGQKESCAPELLAYAVETSWATGRWQDLEKYLKIAPQSESKARETEFDISIAEIIHHLHQGDFDRAEKTIRSSREGIVKSMSTSGTNSIQSCRDQLRGLHVLYELEIISGLPVSRSNERKVVRDRLDRRLPVLGTFVNDKQALLRLRRTAMELSRLQFNNLDRASTFTSSARIARKEGKMGTARSAIISAQNLEDESALIEHARMLWKDGQHRNAIKMLEGAIELEAFRPLDLDPDKDTLTESIPPDQNLLTARALLLWAKWLDTSGQTQSRIIIEKYQNAIRAFARWEKGHYHLGKHYNKLLESEKALPASKQSTAFLCGETAKLVIDNYTRSIAFGNKYIYQTLPRVITLWLEVASEAQQSTRATDSNHDQRQKVLDAIHRQLMKYCNRLPAFPFYTALPQLVSRISHPHPETWKVLQSIITKIISHHPQQAIWSIMAVVRSSNPERCSRGHNIMNNLKSSSKKGKGGSNGLDLRSLINHGQRLCDALLNACEVAVEPRTSHVSLSRNLGFHHPLAPCLLVVPVEAHFAVSLPTKMPQGIKNHKAFPREATTIAAFEDDVLVLSSLQRPRKLTVRGSDGKTYGLLCKPKDDLRKDQRLMEFNAMINRALKRETEASKRRLYIKTYAVTPLNEECGAIEWVEGLKPIRDIMHQIYRNRAVKVDYNEIRHILNAAIADNNEATLKKFWVERLVKHFYPVLHEWFVESFPEPEAWLAARLRYTRSCAVMSMVGHVLGLGDRHGENILLQEGNGGVFHVDFNCLFDKGLTFEKPELVPFRLTHNMVDAMGAYGYEGPFRKSAELTMRTLRSYEDTLMTILETFLYDPTQDFIGRKNRKTSAAGVPDTPGEVLDSVRAKLRGLMRGESVPLSVEGHVEALIKMAVDERNLASMYIGWCAFW
ncbi:hypothetical protein EV356DRAFT_530634 [Viridothelium virens]|uniref:Serine/threonine-protein kinase MEC1 n=1 Tax=Viridothelium virens TaxID=1048519 RepID=A0A6A6HF23_VIRVR|nr:hypothetical protein EV356DRAFT_530634 [Viridothelium virens]